ncbi:MAG TPA: SGNH/GDSL hydrolase family protein [Novosphingobium sp.]|nr:SGNH/GDSL hydrolase family protein [Novosphingobium sp.]
MSSDITAQGLAVSQATAANNNTGKASPSYFETLNLNAADGIVVDPSGRVINAGGVTDAQKAAIMAKVSHATTAWWETTDASTRNGAIVDADGRLIGTDDMGGVVASAAGSRSDLPSRLNVGLTPYGSPNIPIKMAYNLRHTRRNIRARLCNDSAITQIRWLGLGDSYTDGFSYWSSSLSTVDFPAYNGGTANSIGYSSPGWVGFGSSTGASGGIKGTPAPWLYSCVRSGTWTDLFGSDAYSPDICSAYSSTAGDTYTIASASSSNPVQTIAKLFWHGTGSVSYAWNGGSATTINVSSAAALAITALASMPATATWSLVITVVSGTPYLCGVQFDNATVNGMQFFKCAATGQKISGRAAGDATSFATALASFAPNIVSIGTPINDRNAGRTAAQYYTDVQTIISQCRAAIPDIDILLFVPAEISAGYPYWAPMSYYAAKMEQLAAEQSCAMIDFQKLFGADPTVYGPSGVFPLLEATGVHPSITFGARALQDGFIRALVQN